MHEFPLRIMEVSTNIGSERFFSFSADCALQDTSSNAIGKRRNEDEIVRMNQTNLNDIDVFRRK